MTCQRIAPALSVVVLSFASPALAAPVVFSASGGDPASIQAAVDSFRAQLGDPNNAALPGSQPAGRREISWDGGGAGANAAVFPSPMTTFAARGAVFTTGGTGFEISGQPTPEFGDVNATYPDIFQPFSSPRLFAPLGANVMDVLFTVPGTTDQPAVSAGFGAVFTDVDLLGTTTLEFFDQSGQSLLTAAVDPFDGGLSFLGVTFDGPVVSRVRLTLGNAALGPNDSGSTDVVALDDFIYGEPQAVAEPEFAMLAVAAPLLFWLRRRRR